MSRLRSSPQLAGLGVRNDRAPDSADLCRCRGDALGEHIRIDERGDVSLVDAGEGRESRVRIVDSWVGGERPDLQVPTDDHEHSRPRTAVFIDGVHGPQAVVLLSRHDSVRVIDVGKDSTGGVDDLFGGDGHLVRLSRSPAAGCP